MAQELVNTSESRLAASPLTLPQHSLHDSIDTTSAEMTSCIKGEDKPDPPTEM